MNTSGFLLLCIIVVGVKAWPNVKKSSKVPKNSRDHFMHMITECIYVTPESGDYAVESKSIIDSNRPIVKITKSTGRGLYAVDAPDTIAEMTMKPSDVGCEAGGLLRFFDGWSLNGQQLTPIKEHRSIEFCYSNNNKPRPNSPITGLLRPSQNVALLQCRIPVRGSLIANLRFYKISQPCNVLMQSTPIVYHADNFGFTRNCTVSVLLSASFVLAHLKIGSILTHPNINYDCGMIENRLEIGGSTELDVPEIAKAADICGYNNKWVYELCQIFCTLSTVPLLSTGRYEDYASVVLLKAAEIDLGIATPIYTM